MMKIIIPKNEKIEITSTDEGMVIQSSYGCDCKEETSPIVENETPSSLPDFSSKKLIASVRANRKDLIFPASKRDIITVKQEFEGVEEAWLEYKITFEPNFIFGRGGKIGAGLASPDNYGQTGCEPIREDAWSARFMWRGIKQDDEYDLTGFQPKARAVLYTYHQNRVERCGDNIDIGFFEAGKEHHIVQRIKINEPGKDNAEIDVWLDGVHQLRIRDYEFRGDVKDEEGLIGMIYWQSFRGGSADDITWYPPVENKADISEVNAYIN